MATCDSTCVSLHANITVTYAITSQGTHTEVFPWKAFCT